jgi:hypothetical protein
MLPRELAATGAKVSGLLGLGFFAAAALSGQWWFAAGTALGLSNAAGLDTLAKYLHELAYANVGLEGDGRGGTDQPGGSS